MHSVQVQEPQDLFAVFDSLEKGASVALSQGEIALAAAARPPSEDRAWLGLCSSGSTGKAKLVWWAWDELKQHASRAQQARRWTWATPFRPSTFAGLQVALQAWVDEGKVCLLTNDWQAAWGVIEDKPVHALSSTPTFIDLLLQYEGSAGTASTAPGFLQQITLGGEVLRPALGARLLERFPSARFTVIYATTELGLVAKTHRLDGWCEIASLQKMYPRWRERGGVLEVEHRGAWQSTADLVEIKGDLFRVVGRADAVANVAGRKVRLAQVSELAEQVRGVRRAVATAVHNSVAGQVVGLKYAIEPGFEAALVAEELGNHLRARLSKEAWPRFWELDEVGPVNNAKRLAG